MFTTQLKELRIQETTKMCDKNESNVLYKLSPPYNAIVTITAAQGGSGANKKTVVLILRSFAS